MDALMIYMAKMTIGTTNSDPFVDTTVVRLTMRDENGFNETEKNPSLLVNWQGLVPPFQVSRNPETLKLESQEDSERPYK